MVETSAAVYKILFSFAFQFFLYFFKFIFHFFKTGFGGFDEGGAGLDLLQPFLDIGVLLHVKPEGDGLEFFQGFIEVYFGHSLDFMGYVCYTGQSRIDWETWSVCSRTVTPV